MPGFVSLLIKKSIYFILSMFSYLVFVSYKDCSYILSPISRNAKYNRHYNKVIIRITIIVISSPEGGLLFFRSLERRRMPFKICYGVPKNVSLRFAITLSLFNRKVGWPWPPGPPGCMGPDISRILVPMYK